MTLSKAGSIVLFLFSLLLAGCATLATAQDIYFTRAELQQGLEGYLPYSQEYPLLKLTLEQPELTLLAAEQRIQIRAALTLSTAFTGTGQGWVTLSGQPDYRPAEHSFYIKDLALSELQVTGLPAELNPHLKQLTQDILAPLLAEQPIYTLSDNNMQESLAKMMLRSLTVKEDAVVASLSLF